MSKVAELLESLPWGPAPEDSKLALEWLDSHGRDFGVFVDGEWQRCGTSFATLNPANGKELAQIGQADAEMVDKAMQAAATAMPGWQALGGEARAKFVYAIARQIQKNSRLFAVVESLDNGKPIRETRDIDIPLVARHFYYHAGWASLVEKEFPDYKPVGVCGQIIPWNFPLLMLAWKIAPAIAAGNTVVLKPAEFTSLTALLFAEICEKAGLPKGVVNIVTGDGRTGAAIVEHERVDKIAFTGSTEVGRIIREATSGTTKKLSLELGGKSPFIVFEDADLDSAVEGLVDAIWFNQGQVCCAGSRLLVQEGIADKVYAKIRARMDKLRVGDPLDKAVDLGAIVDRSQLERVSSLVEQGVQEGATKYQSHCDLPTNGFFYPPTLLTDVEPSSTVAQVEIFGPVLVGMTFRTPAEAVALANNTVYGLAGCVWTQNLDIAHDIAAQVKAGTIWINCTNQFDASAGFGGYRESGFGREGGQEGLLEYLSWKQPVARVKAAEGEPRSGGIDRTHKQYIGGKQARPDGGYSFEVNGEEFARGNRKDIRNAVEAAEAAQPGWAGATAYLRSQILYYMAENLAAAKQQIVAACALGASRDPEAEFERSLSRILHFAAWADKYDGKVHQVPGRSLVYTRNEPLGTVGVIAPNEWPLLGFLGSCLPLISMGNTVVAVPSESNPLPAVELVRVMEASDVPSGVWNVVTGTAGELTKPLADHLGCAAIWHFRGDPEASVVRASSTGNLKQTWCCADLDWEATPGQEMLRRATQVKNIWVPFGS